jgi:hypothetical protein
MAENKTVPTKKSVTEFIKSISDKVKQQDSYTLIEMLRNITGYDPVMWGSAIIGFGTYHYKYESGREGDMPLACFSPRKTELVVYLTPVFSGKDELLRKLGKHKGSKACIYIKKLEDIDLVILKKLIVESIKRIQEEYSS